MTLLSKKLAELAERYSATHRDEHALIVELNKRLERQDEHLRDELVAVIEGHDVRRAGLHELLQALSARVGLLPPASGAGPQPRLGNGSGPQVEQQAIDNAIDDAEPIPGFLRAPRQGAGSPISETVPTH